MSERHRLSILGCGRAAGTLAGLWLQQGAVSVHRICNRTPASTRRAVDRLGQGVAVDRLQALFPADILLLGITDSLLPEIDRLLLNDGPPAVKVVFHLSGVHDAEVLAALRTEECRIAAVHPARSFSGAAISPQRFTGTPCIARGDQQALALLRDLFLTLGADWQQPDALDQRLYHAGTVFAGNYSTTLASLARSTLIEAGLPADSAARVQTRLMRGVVDNLAEHGVLSSLTGPIDRGDATTVEAHLDALQAFPELHRAYLDLARETLRLAVEKGRLNASAISRIADLLAQHD